MYQWDRRNIKDGGHPISNHPRDTQFWQFVKLHRLIITTSDTRNLKEGKHFVEYVKQYIFMLNFNVYLKKYYVSIN